MNTGSEIRTKVTISNYPFLFFSFIIIEEDFNFNRSDPDRIWVSYGSGLSLGSVPGPVNSQCLDSGAVKLKPDS